MVRKHVKLLEVVNFVYHSLCNRPVGCQMRMMITVLRMMMMMMIKILMMMLMMISNR